MQRGGSCALYEWSCHGLPGCTGNERCSSFQCESCPRICCLSTFKGLPRAIPGGTFPTVALGRSYATDRTSFIETLLQNLQNYWLSEVPRGSTWLQCLWPLYLIPVRRGFSITMDHDLYMLCEFFQLLRYLAPYCWHFQLHSNIYRLMGSESSHLVSTCKSCTLSYQVLESELREKVGRGQSAYSFSFEVII